MFYLQLATCIVTRVVFVFIIQSILKTRVSNFTVDTMAHDIVLQLSFVVVVVSSFWSFIFINSGMHAYAGGEPHRTTQLFMSLL